MARSAPTIEGLTDTLRLQSQCSLIATDDGCGNKSPTTFAAAKMKFTIPFPNDNNTTKGTYFSSSSSTPSATKMVLKKQPSWVAKKTVSTVSLENDEDGYELKKKAKANTTNSDSDEEVTKQSTADKEKRATNKKILAEVLQKNPQFKAELSVYNAFGPEHWKVLLSQMVNVGDYINQLFFGQSIVSGR